MKRSAFDFKIDLEVCLQLMTEASQALQFAGSDHKGLFHFSGNQVKSS